MRLQPKSLLDWSTMGCLLLAACGGPPDIPVEHVDGGLVRPAFAPASTEPTPRIPPRFERTCWHDETRGPERPLDMLRARLLLPDGGVPRCLEEYVIRGRALSQQGGGVSINGCDTKGTCGTFRLELLLPAGPVVVPHSTGDRLELFWYALPSWMLCDVLQFTVRSMDARPRVLAVGTVGTWHAPRAAGFTTRLNSLECHRPSFPSNADDFAIEFMPRDIALAPLQLETKEEGFLSIDRYRPPLRMRNVRSYQSTNSDDYWDYSYIGIAP